MIIPSANLPRGGSRSATSATSKTTNETEIAPSNNLFRHWLPQMQRNEVKSRAIGGLFAFRKRLDTENVRESLSNGQKCFIRIQSQTKFVFKLRTTDISSSIENPHVHGFLWLNGVRSSKNFDSKLQDERYRSWNFLDKVVTVWNLAIPLQFLPAPGNPTVWPAWLRPRV